jgi:hypothetical protein
MAVNARPDLSVNQNECRRRNLQCKGEAPGRCSLTAIAIQTKLASRICAILLDWRQEARGRLLLQMTHHLHHRFPGKQR